MTGVVLHRVETHYSRGRERNFVGDYAGILRRTGEQNIAAAVPCNTGYSERAAIADIRGEVKRREVRVKRRDGRTYSVRPEGNPSARMLSIPDFARRRKAIFRKTIPVRQARRVDKLIASE